MTKKFLISLIIPCYNEEKNLPILCKYIKDLINSCSDNIQVIFINDASNDSTLTILNSFMMSSENIVVINNTINIGCHLSVKKGFDCATGEWFIFLPSDLQILPSIILDIVPLMDSSDFVATWRQDRQDLLHRRIISRFYNYIVRFITNIQINDFDSSIAIRSSLYHNISHKLTATTASLAVEIAAHSVRDGARIVEVPIAHYPRTAGTARGLNWRDSLAAPIHLLRLWMMIQNTR
jgi:glycosyltransferase involved in cell wall biosynthesis